MIELLGIEEKTYTLNLGPQHPSTHGVLRVLLEMDGEFIIKAEPVIGYGHRGHEHMAENRNYAQFLPNLGRVDYLFLKGMRPHATGGRFHLKVPLELILHLETLVETQKVASWT